jgi:hypothetical protein
VNRTPPATVGPRRFATLLFAALVGVSRLANPASVVAQESGELFVSGGIGGSYYCIVSRCDEGSVLRLGAGYSFNASVTIDAGVRLHDCFDCDQFLIYEGGAQLRYPSPRAQPFVAAGIHRSTDPDFMGSRTGAYLGVGVSFGPWRRFHLALEVRGRDFGSGDRMGEATLTVLRGF